MFSSFGSSLTSFMNDSINTISSSVASAQAALQEGIADEEKKLATIKQFKVDKAAAEEEAKDNCYPAVPWRIFEEKSIILEAELRNKISQLTRDNSIFINNHRGEAEKDRKDGNIFVFDYNNAYFQVFAELALENNETLQQARYSLVPKLISEEEFWRIYFFQIELIRLNMNIHSLFEKPTPQQIQFYKEHVAAQERITQNLENNSKKVGHSNAALPLAKPVPPFSPKEKIATTQPKATAQPASSAQSAAAAVPKPSENSHNNNSAKKSVETEPTTAASRAAEAVDANSNDLAELESLLADVEVDAENAEHEDLLESELDLELELESLGHEGTNKEEELP
jgi:flavin-binding protein dodecin